MQIVNKKGKKIKLEEVNMQDSRSIIHGSTSEKPSLLYDNLQTCNTCAGTQATSS